MDGWAGRSHREESLGGLWTVRSGLFLSSETSTVRLEVEVDVQVRTEGWETVDFGRPNPPNRHLSGRSQSVTMSNRVTMYVVRDYLNFFTGFQSFKIL